MEPTDTTELTKDNTSESSILSKEEAEEKADQPTSQIADRKIDCNPTYKLPETPCKVFDFMYIGNLQDAQNLPRLKEIGFGYVINLAYGTDNPFESNFKVHDREYPLIPNCILL